MISEGKIKVNQTLHGYSEGHRLLESSIDLPRGAEHTMLIMSDMSGPSMVSGFESYITGYAIDELDMFALGKTWYAPEMDRPGCVWTHTLLIRSNDLALLNDLRIFLRLFDRPSIDGTWSHYKSYLEVPTSKTIGPPTQYYNVSPNIASRLIEALYSKPDLPIYIPSQDTKKYESFIFAIWSQQWPRLRESFYFCTGSIANRKMNGKPFDIQIIPVSSLSQVKREISESVIFTEMDSNSGVSKVSNWAEVATLDLFEDSKGRFRQFLWNFGDDIPGRRASFASLTKVYLCTEDVNSGKLPLRILIETVGQFFPLPEEALSLKRQMFSEVVTGKNKRLLPNINGSDLLIELLTNRHYNAFASKYLNIDELAKQIWPGYENEVKKLILKLIDLDLNPLGESFLTEISRVISTNDVTNLVIN